MRSPVQVITGTPRAAFSGFPLPLGPRDYGSRKEFFRLRPTPLETGWRGKGLCLARVRDGQEGGAVANYGLFFAEGAIL
jgi:hypothetical protein